jgi:hypothetical protein
MSLFLGKTTLEGMFCSFFCLDTKETKNQGKHHRSAGFSLPALGKSLRIDIKKWMVIRFHPERK